MHRWMVLMVICAYASRGSAQNVTESTTSADNVTESTASADNATIAAETSTTPTPTQVKVLIIGAGMAGLAAARTLQQGGVGDFIVLEGSSRVGGRLKHSLMGGVPVEHGAVWVHGGEGNPMLELARQYNVSLFYDDFEDYVCRGEGGEDVTEALDEAYERFELALEMRDNKSEIMLELDQPDMNQRAYFQRAGWFAKTPEEFVAEVFDIDFDYSYPPSETSTKYPGEYTYWDFADEDYFTLSPYSAIPQGLSDEMFSENDSMQRLFLDSVVSEIKQVEQGEGGQREGGQREGGQGEGGQGEGGQGEGERVTVTTTDGHTFQAEHVIVAVSLGVLQNYHLKFSPDLPDWKWDAIQGFQFSHYLHFYLRFPSVFWDDTLYILHASKIRGHYTVWQNLNKLRPGCNILQANVIQYESQRLQALPDELVQADAMAVLRDMYGDSIPDAIEIVVPRFGTDPLFMGAFSNWPPGYTMESFRSLKANVGRIHFAGEYAHARYYGYAHGALLSGEEVAGNVITCLTEPKKCERDHVPAYEARGCTYNAAANHDPTAQADDGSCRFEACPSTSSVGDFLPAWSLIIFIAAARHVIE